MGGIALPALSAAAISGAGNILVYAEGGNSTISALGNALKPYRPPQWSSPALAMLTIPAQYARTVSSSSVDEVNASLTQVDGMYRMTTKFTESGQNTAPQYLVFDGVMSISHSQAMVATEHPVQNTANLSDHIRATQAIVTMDVLMTDVFPSFAPDQWVGNSSKSVACFQTLDNLRLNRIPLTVTTRLKTYYPMFIMNVTPDETVKTRYGFRGRIEFKQLNLFSLATQTVSARPQSTDSNTIGQTNPTAVPAGVMSQNGVPNSNAIQNSTGTVECAGDWSSNNSGSLPKES